jgi:hypothetical protein
MRKEYRPVGEESASSGSRLGSSNCLFMLLVVTWYERLSLEFHTLDISKCDARPDMNLMRMFSSGCQC